MAAAYQEGHMLSKGRQAGMGVGCSAALEAKFRNTCMLKRDNASAIWLACPGIWVAETVKLPRAAIRKRLRSNDIICGHRAVPERRQLTTVMLSDTKRTFFLAHWLPQTRAAMTIG